MRGLGHVESIAYERRHAVVIETASSVHHVSVLSEEFEKGLSLEKKRWRSGGVSHSPIESVMNTFSQSSTTMSHRQPMWWMARDNDLEGITRLLDEGVDPAADEERESGVRLMIGHCNGWTGGRVSLWCVVDALLTVCNRAAVQLSITPPVEDTSPWCSC
jgi:hypothetical protein